MTSTTTIVPTSTLTPLDIVPSSGSVTFHYDECAINERENFKRLGSFWQRQMSPKGIAHAKALACIGLKTNALANVQNVKSNFANDRQNLYFSAIEVPLEGALPVSDHEDAIAALQNGENTFKSYLVSKPDQRGSSASKYPHYAGQAADMWMWKLKPGYIVDNIRINIPPMLSHHLESGIHYKQIGQWLIFKDTTYWQIRKKHPSYFVPKNYYCLCSGHYSINSYFGQSFYKPVLGLEYLPVGPGAQFVAEYISGKHQDLRSLEIVLNTLVGLESNFGRNNSKVIQTDANSIDSNTQKEMQLTEDAEMAKRFMILQDKVTDEIYSLPYMGNIDDSINNTITLPPNSFGRYLIQLATKKESGGESFSRVSAHTGDSEIAIDMLSSLAIYPRDLTGTKVSIYYKYNEIDESDVLTPIIRDNLDTALIVHLGKINDWDNYHKYMSSRSDYFASHFKTFKDLINYVIRFVKDYAPLTYTPIFTCTHTLNGVETTSDYNLYLYLSNDNS